MKNKNRQVLKNHHKTFEDIRQKTAEGAHFWFARDLQVVLGYSSWDKFKTVIQKAVKACENSGNSPSAHFSRLGKMVKIGLGVTRHIPEQIFRTYCPFESENFFVLNGDAKQKNEVLKNEQKFAKSHFR